MRYKDYILAKLYECILVGTITASVVSCSSMDNEEKSNFGSIVQLNEFNYNTNEKASLKLFNLPDYKFDVSDEKVYAKKVFHFEGDNINLSKALTRDAEESSAFTGSETALTSY